MDFKHLLTLHLEIFTGNFRPMVSTHDCPQFSLLDVILLVTFFLCFGVIQRSQLCTDLGALAVPILKPMSNITAYLNTQTHLVLDTIKLNKFVPR